MCQMEKMKQVIIGLTSTGLLLILIVMLLIPSVVKSNKAEGMVILKTVMEANKRSICVGPEEGNGLEEIKTVTINSDIPVKIAVQEVGMDEYAHPMRLIMSELLRVNHYVSDSTSEDNEHLTLNIKKMNGGQTMIIELLDKDFFQETTVIMKMLVLEGTEVIGGNNVTVTGV